MKRNLRVLLALTLVLALALAACEGDRMRHRAAHLYNEARHGTKFGLRSGVLS